MQSLQNSSEDGLLFRMDPEVHHKDEDNGSSYCYGRDFVNDVKSGPVSGSHGTEELYVKRFFYRGQQSHSLTDLSVHKNVLLII